MRQTKIAEPGIFLGITLMLFGLTISLVNSTGIFHHFSLGMQLAMIVSGLLLTTFGIFLCLSNKWPVYQENLLFGNLARKALFPGIIIFFFVYVGISLIGLHSGKSSWTDSASVVFNIITFFITLYPLLPKYGTISPELDLPSPTLHPTDRRYTNIKVSPPSVDPEKQQSYEAKANEVYTMLAQPGAKSTSIILSSFSSKVTLTVASIIYQIAKEGREAKDSIFGKTEIWLDIHPGNTLADIIFTLCQEQGIVMPDIAHMHSYSQAEKLIEILNANEPCLIVFNQLENWLQDGRREVDECLDKLNKRLYNSRVLITYHAADNKSNNFPDHPIHLIQLQIPVFSSSVRPFHRAFNAGRLDEEEIESRYNNLHDPERRLSEAFSLYRKSVPLSAIEEHLSATSGAKKKRLSLACDTLIGIQWLQQDDKSYYQLIPAIVECVERHFMENKSERSKQRVLKREHMKAAKYYKQQVREIERSGNSWIGQKQDFLLEVAWHLCQAGKQHEAFIMAEQEDLFSFFEKSQNINQLLQLCELFRPSNTWYPDRKIANTVNMYKKRGFDVLESI